MYNYGHITCNYNLVPIKNVLSTGKLGTEKVSSLLMVLFDSQSGARVQIQLSHHAVF